MNKYESDAITAKLIENGYTLSDSDVADLYIVNTCAVTAESEKKSRQYIAKCLKHNKNAKIVVCGCASQNNIDQFKDKPNVFSVIGTEGKQNIVDIIENQTFKTFDVPNCYESIANPLITENNRAFLKIQDGCNNFCNYCLIPYLRGRSRSRAINDIVAEANELSKKCKEIVISGIDISSFQPSLGELMKQLYGVNSRIRLGSLEVNVITPELLDILKNMPNFCPQFHLSLQSGCDSVLKRMNRHYTAAQFKQKVDLIRSYFPYANITTDIIVGFAMETEDEFSKTCDFVKSVGFGAAHIFPYSVRKGTVASKLYKEDLPLSVKKHRVDVLEDVVAECKKSYISSLIGKTFTVLTEDKEDDHIVGYSENYIKFYLPLSAKTDTLIKVKLLSCFLDGATGEIKEWNMEDCLFCKMINGDISTDKVYEDDLMIIIKDINPKAPLHYLAIPKNHYKYLIEQHEDDTLNLGKILNKISKLSTELGLYNGYRLVINQGDDAGQTVPHLHIHILAGKPMDWNPA